MDQKHRQGQLLVDRVKPIPSLLIILLRFALLGIPLAAVVAADELLAILSLPVWFLIGCANFIRCRNFRRNLTGLPCLTATATVEQPSVLPGATLIASARNEADGIEAAVRSFAALDFADLEVIVVDDHSTDSTPEILDRLARELPAIRIIHKPPLRPGWFGKSNAIWHAAHAASQNGTWFVLTDADVRFHPLALRQLVAHAEARGLDFLTCCPRLEMGSFSEDLILPIGWHDLLSLYHYEDLGDPGAFPIGIGACILVRRTVYFGSGGHASFEGRNPEDTLLAAAVQRSGGRMGVAWTPDLLRIRYHRGWCQVREGMICKARMMGDDRLRYPAYLLSLRALPLLLPLPLALAGLGLQVVSWQFSAGFTAFSIAGILVYLANVPTYAGLDRICDVRPWMPWLHPVSGLVRGWVCIVAMVRILARTRLDWRERDVTPGRSDTR